MDIICGMKLTADIQIIPIGVGVSLSSYIAVCERILKDAGLETNLHSHGTNVQGQWEDVFSALRKCHEVLHEMGVPRISTSIKVGTRTDKPETLQSRIQSVRQKA